MRYFTDFTDDRGLSLDEEGLPFADRHEACLSATEALIARHRHHADDYADVDDHLDWQLSDG